jgi:hypothetical protein
MDEHENGRLQGRRGSLRRASVALFILVLAAGPVAACAGAPADAATWTAMPTMHGGVPTVDPGSAAGAQLAAADAMWATRPAFVGTNPKTEAAYHYAIHHPEIVEWMPCYCGCEAMGHGSNLACYVTPEGAFEEHASYCEICVDITLKAKELTEQGMSLREVRQAIDATWGHISPGTPTALPPA